MFAAMSENTAGLSGGAPQFSNKYLKGPKAATANPIPETLEEKVGNHVVKLFESRLELLGNTLGQYMETVKEDVMQAKTEVAELNQKVESLQILLQTQAEALIVQLETLKEQSETLKEQSETLKEQSETLERVIQKMDSNTITVDLGDVQTEDENEDEEF